MPHSVRHRHGADKYPSRLPEAACGWRTPRSVAPERARAPANWRPGRRFALLRLNFLISGHKRPTIADPDRLGSGFAGQAPPRDPSAATVANLDVGRALVHLGAPPCRSPHGRDRHGDAVADPAIRTSGLDASSASSKTGRRLPHPCASTNPTGVILQRPFRRSSRSLGTLPPDAFEDPQMDVHRRFRATQLRTSIHGRPTPRSAMAEMAISGLNPSFSLPS